jgi:hypothetical protein
MYHGRSIFLTRIPIAIGLRDAALLYQCILVSRALLAALGGPPMKRDERRKRGGRREKEECRLR